MKKALLVLIPIFLMSVAAEASFEDAADSTVLVNQGDHEFGSGVIYEDYIITSYHVVEDSEDLEVAFSTGETVEADNLAGESSTDLALLEADIPEQLQPLELADETTVNQEVAAIGYPYASELDITEGKVLETGVTLELQQENKVFTDMIFTDAEIRPGNSGGPLVDQEDDIHGIVTAKSPEGGYTTSLNDLEQFLQSQKR